MNYHEKIIGDIEVHSVEGIQECFANGVDPNDVFRGEPLIYELTSGYLRSPGFKSCVKAFVENGLKFEDKLLLSVLLDDGSSLDRQLIGQPEAVNNKYTLRCAFTPLYQATLLHICAEFNHVTCAEVLMKHGADINARAGIDEYGFGSQTALFHTVNQIRNASASMLHYLLKHSADLQITLRGLTWGKGYEWETFIPAVNPLSYAMMGLLPQMHRNEITIRDTVILLLKETYGVDFVPPNVPNEYLRKSER